MTNSLFRLCLKVREAFKNPSHRKPSVGGGVPPFSVKKKSVENNSDF